MGQGVQKQEEHANQSHLFNRAKSDLTSPPYPCIKLFIPRGFLLVLLSWKPYHNLVHKWICWTLAHPWMMLSSRQMFSARFSGEPHPQHSPLSLSAYSTALYRARRCSYALACCSQACWHWFQTAAALLEQRFPLLASCSIDRIPGPFLWNRKAF